jgi:hypothetical protein
MLHVNVQTAYNTPLDVPPLHTRHAISYDAFVVTVSYSNSPGGRTTEVRKWLAFGWAEIFHKICTPEARTR